MTSTPPERIRAARERAGLEVSDVAEKVALPFAHYCDLEAFEDEAWTTISLETLQRLGRTLGLTPRQILEGNDAPAPSRRMSFAEFSSAVAKAVNAAGGDVDAWGEHAGWDVAPLLEAPEKLWGLDAEALR